jgi:hypothetical protein
MLETMSRKVFVIQKPRPGHQFDLEAVKKLGELEFIIPNPPNVHDPVRIATDLGRMRKVVKEAHPADIFIALGGAPISLMIFGAACALEGKEFQLGMFNRGQDADGRRTGNGGSYRLVPVSLA